MPSTAGRFVTETELRTYTKCSQLHFYQGEHRTPRIVALTRFVFEALTSHSVRKDILDPLFLIQKYLERGTRELGYHDLLVPEQLQQLRRHATLVLGEIFSVFSFEKYIPVFGPMAYNVKISKTPVTLEISGLYRSLRNQTLHIACFSPYTDEHAAANDPLVLLKLQTLKRVVKAHYRGRAQAKLHIFGVNPGENCLLYSSRESGDVRASVINQIKNLVMQMETGSHYPLVPCPHDCRFKRRCFPENQ